MNRKKFRIGLDIGGSAVKMALVDATGAVVDRRSVATVGRAPRLVEELRRSAEGWFRQGIRGTGVGVAGDVDPVTGTIRFSANLGWRRVPLARLLRQAGFPGPIVVDNDANAAAWGAFHLEYRRRIKHLVVLTLGTGVGGGFILDGRLFRGATGSAGEVGHMVVLQGGDPCACGGRGCLETYVGAAGMTRWARQVYRREGRPEGRLDPKVLEDRARTGDRVARRAYGRLSGALGAGLINLVNLFNPERILLTGGVARGADLFLPAALKEMNRRAFPTPARAVRVEISSRVAELGVAGAALLVE